MIESIHPPEEEAPLKEHINGDKDSLFLSLRVFTVFFFVECDDEDAAANNEEDVASKLDSSSAYADVISLSFKCVGCSFSAFLLPLRYSLFFKDS